jgi:serine protein kinase
MSANRASVFDDLIAEDLDTREVEMTMEEYLELCKTDPSAYANPWQRLLKAIGEPEIIDFNKEPKLRQIFEGMPTVRYPGLADFYGIEDTLQKVVAAIRSGAQGGEESKQILYLLGPVGSSKSSLAKRISELMEQEPFYAIKGSPVFDNPLKALDFRRYGKAIEENYHIDPLLLKGALSPWATKRLNTELGRDWRKFKVVKIYPSINEQRAISRVEASDKNNKDVSSIVGKVDLSKLEDGMAQHDADAYGYFGGLNRGNRGMMEYVEMFKDPIDTLNPLLAATQDRQYNGTEGIGALPFEGIILAHSNEAEWDKFRNDRTNEAFIDRCKIIKVPYTLRVSAELDIYRKYIRENQLRKAPCAPGTLEMQSTFAVQSRLMQPKDGSNIETKMKVYDGERTNDPKAKTIAAYRKEAYDAKSREGMTGWSVRDSFKALSDTFNLHAAEGEVSATPVDLMFVLDRMIRGQDLPDETRDRYLALIETKLKPEYAKSLDAQIKEALVESFSSYGQNLFERYVRYAELSLEEYDDHIDPITKSTIKKADIEKELQAIEKPAGITNPTGFRNDVVRFVTKYQRDNEGRMPDWTTYKKFAEAIQSKIFSSTKELMPLISFGPKGSTEDEKKHADFVDRMVARGYPRQALPQIVQWYEKNKPA